MMTDGLGLGIYFGVGGIRDSHPFMRSFRGALMYSLRILRHCWATFALRELFCDDYNTNYFVVA